MVINIRMFSLHSRFASALALHQPVERRFHLAGDCEGDIGPYPLEVSIPASVVATGYTSDETIPDAKSGVGH